MQSISHRAAMVSAMVLTALTLVLPATPAMAHDDAHMETVKAPHDGQLRMAGDYHFELVVVKNSKEAKENPVLVYVTDHAGNKITTTGASGTVTLLGGKSKASVTLLPAGDNLLKGSAKYASAPDLKAVVAITLPGKAPEQVRFTPMAASKGQ